MNAVSAGGIVFNGEKICFIRYENGKLGFPKGTPEAGESLEGTAVREVGEETGLQNPKIIKKLGMFTRPGYVHNQSVLKDIHIYLMEVDDFTQGKQEEITEWLTPREAFPRLFTAEAEFLKFVLTA